MRTHGHSSGGKVSPTYISWRAMKQRCYCPKINDYAIYGGRGIKVCAQWMRFSGFLKDMGVRPNGMILDRICNDKDYEPGNCRWVTPRQSANNRKNTAFVVFKGNRLPASDVDRALGFSKGVARKRAKFVDASSVHYGNSRPGSLNPGSKFSDQMVREIRSMSGTDRQLAKVFGVAKSTIYFLRKRKTYQNVT